MIVAESTATKYHYTCLLDELADLREVLKLLQNDPRISPIITVAGERHIISIGDDDDRIKELVIGLCEIRLSKIRHELLDDIAN